MSCISHDNIFLLGSAFQDIKYPVQASLFALRLHERPDMVFVDLWCFSDHANLLIRVFLDML